MGYKIVINKRYGGFGLSEHALKLGKELSGDPDWGDWDMNRHDPVLVEVVERLGEAANGRYAKLNVKKIESRLYYIDEYHGNEEVITPETMDWIEIDD